MKITDINNKEREVVAVYINSEYEDRDIIIKIKQEDEDEWKFLFIENVDDNTDVLFAKVIGIVGDKEKAKEVSFRIQEQVSKGNKNFKLSVKEA